MEFQVQTDVMTVIGGSPKICDTITVSAFKVGPN